MVLAVTKTRIAWKQRAGMRILMMHTTESPESDPPLARRATETSLAAGGYDIQSMVVQLRNCNAHQTANLASLLKPQVILVEAVGDTIEHPDLVEVTQTIRRIMPKTRIVYLSNASGSCWREALTNQPQIDYILRWGDIDSLLGLFENFKAGQQIPRGPGIAYWYHGQPVLF